jgi:hypothetical protein
MDIFLGAIYLSGLYEYLLSICIYLFALKKYLFSLYKYLFSEFIKFVPCIFCFGVYMNIIHLVCMVILFYKYAYLSVNSYNMFGKYKYFIP